jgi:hypothetical protein
MCDGAGNTITTILADWHEATKKPRRILGTRVSFSGRALTRALVQHAEKPKQNDDGDRDADQPEQNATHREGFLCS